MTENVKGDVENGGAQRMSPWRIAAWGAAALLLLLPLIAMQFTDEVNWSASDFVFAGVLFFGSLGAYEITARKPGSVAYRAGVGLAIAAVLLLLWGNGAVSITDSAADMMYYGVAALGVVGVVIALRRPGGGALAMIAAALALVAAGVVTLAAGAVPNPYVSAFELTGITGFYIALFAGAAWLLWEAAQEGPREEPGQQQSRRRT